MFKAALIKSGLAASVLLLASGASYAQTLPQQVNLTAAPTTVAMPDGSVVPMWGYNCGTAVVGSTAACAALNPHAPAATLTTPAGWSPVVITVPYTSTTVGTLTTNTTTLQINLANNLTFQPATGAANNIPTSLTIVGQLGGGLGTVGAGCTGGATCTASPAHGSQVVTWSTVGAAPAFTPPGQTPRVQSFGTEVAATPASTTPTTAPLCWGNCAVGQPGLNPGTYLIESGTHPSIQGPMGLYGILVVTTAPTSATVAGTAYPGYTPPTVNGIAGTPVLPVTYNAEVPLLFGEIDPVQNAAVNAAVNTAGFLETNVWSGQPGGCGNPLTLAGAANTTFNTCYPPAVNYTPLFYTINGVGFSRTTPANSLFPATAGTVTTGFTPTTGTVLVRMVNAGSHMHLPSIVGAQTTQLALTTTPTATVTAVPGFSLIAEDGNRLPGIPHVQSDVFMPAGKTYDVMINVPAAGTTALAVYDRELSLSGNATERDAGMLAYIGVNGSVQPTTASEVAAVANADSYASLVPCAATPCAPVVVSDPGKGVIANDVNVYGVTLMTTPAPTGGTVVLNRNGTFTFTPAVGATSGGFSYCANGSVSATVACSSGISTTVALSGAAADGTITVPNQTFTSNMGTYINIRNPGVLTGATDSAGYPLTLNPLYTPTVTPGLTLVATDANGGFSATASGAGIGCPAGSPVGATCFTFTFQAKSARGTVQTGNSTATLVFPKGSGLAVTVLDGYDRTSTITDYRWVIEEDETFYVDPSKATNSGGTSSSSTCSAGTGTTGCIVPTFGVNFHTSHMPFVAQGCTGTVSCEGGQMVVNPATGVHGLAVCDVGNGACRADTAGTGFVPVNPSQVVLDPTKRYYISVLPGDAGNPFSNGNATADCTNGVSHATNPAACGHGMGGAPIAAGQTSVTILAQPDPFPPSKLSVFVYQDDFPLNGEQDGGGGIDVLSPNEPGLGHFNLILFDDAGGTGDATGQMTYDMFNMPLGNSLAGTIDPATGFDACPISTQATNDPTQNITGTIVTCPKYESDGKTLTPLAGQAVIANLMPGRYGVVAFPGADRIANGEEWLQTNTLDGQKAHDSFLRVSEPSYFQEYGPAGFHVSVGFANPKIINDRLAGICSGADPNLTGSNCHNTVAGTITTNRMSRTPDERLYSSGDNSSFAFTQCYVSIGDPDGEDFAFAKCDSNGNFTLSGLPNGDWRVTVFDQWNDVLVDGLSTPVRLSGSGANMGQIAMNQWQANIYTKSFIDLNHDGVQDNDVSGNLEPGLTLVPTNIRFRDGSYSNFNNTDLQGNAGFNEIFPLFSWYVVESDSTRFKNTGTHVVYDKGGPADGTCNSTTAPCGPSTTNEAFLANTAEQNSVPAALRVPGARYCANPDCPAGDSAGGSTGRVDPAWVTSEGWQGFSGQNSFIDFGKIPFVAGETGGIHGEVIYASTRPFDDPSLLIHTSWTPDVPGVTINLYQEGTAPDGSQSLKLVDTTKTSSFDDWAQGFYPGTSNKPYMSCPGQFPAPTTTTYGDPFYFSLFNQPDYLDVYNNQHSGTPLHTIPNNSQFKCYDGMHNWNQVQPAPYDGMYQFPSIIGRNPTTGVPTGTGSANGTAGSRPGSNCTICVANPTDGTPMLPAGKYVVEMVVPPGYELVKEEDKNILIGDNYIAPAVQQFGGLGSIYILPDQAAIGAEFNANNAQNSNRTLGRPITPQSEGDTGSVEVFWPCVGASRIVPDYISLFPQSHEVAPFAGATRNLCDRKEVTLADQASALAKFWVFTSAHVAAHFTGIITDDFTSEFDPFSPMFGEKFSPANLPVSIKDWTGTEISRVYTDQWGAYDGLTYSTWEVNPPNPTGYAPTMMVTCMNDPGTGPTPDPLFNPAYSQFCYEIPFMPGQTQYMDTPVVPTSAFAGAGYNNVDCAYPTLTPAIKEVDGDGIGPWVSAAGPQRLTITALGDQYVNNYAYSGPSATVAPYNQKTVLRHYGFGSGAGSVALVGSDGVPHALTAVSWSDLLITGNVPTGVPNCAVQQQAQYGGPTGTTPLAKCGELVITTANTAGAGQPSNAKQSIDTVTVTIGGKAPVHVLASASIQSAIDAAKPGDLLMIDPTCATTLTGPPVACTTGTTFHTNSSHVEILIMWKPLRLQGVGAASSIINANTHPAGKMDVWRRQVNCLFGLSISGYPLVTPTGTTQYDPSGTYTCLPSMQFQVDRLPLEAVIGWDATQNGNMAELLQEPSLMGALEGAAITVLSKGVQFPAGSDPFGVDPTTPGLFPTGTTLLTAGNCGANTTTAHNPFPGNFQCNPSSIDGLGITDSSHGGGGIFVHGWGHELWIANNRITNNSGTLTGGISVGQGEYPPPYIQGSATNAPPGSCEDSPVAGIALPYCHNVNVTIQNNYVALNASTGDELFTATPAGAGGVSICTGADYYEFNYNWVCGNLSMGDGGGVAHFGFSYNGDIEHNTITFNQSTNPTLTTYGGGLIAEGVGPDGTLCENSATVDLDCPPQLPNGVGPGLLINANLIMGNTAEGGSGGGLRLQKVNGTDVARNPNNPAKWYEVTVTNNIIANNVAGWGGGGVSMLDSLRVNFVNNTVVSNDTTATGGILFDTNVAPNANVPPPGCDPTITPPTPACTNTSVTTSNFMVAGLQADVNSGQLTGVMTNPNVNCPLHPGCAKFSNPVLRNNLFWQNRSFHITTGAIPAPGLETTVQLVPAMQQTTTGACPGGADYWDIGVYGDTSASNHGSGYTLSPAYSILTDASDYGSASGFGVSFVISIFSAHPADSCWRIPGRERRRKQL